MTQKRGVPLRLMAGGALVLLLAAFSEARAEEPPADPFSALQKWVAVDDYESVKEALIAAQKMNEETEVQTQSQKAPATDPLSPPTPEEAKVAEPVRPLDLPVALGGVQTTSTAGDEAPAKENNQAVLSGKQNPEIQIKEWMDLAAFDDAQERLQQAEKLAPATSEEPEVAGPVRPLDLPVAQGGLQKVAAGAGGPSAEEEKRQPLLPEDQIKEWIDIASDHAALDRLWHTEKLLKPEEENAFKVRFSNLPNQDVRSILSGRISKPKLSYQEEAEKKVIQKAPVIAEQASVDKKKIEADTKACEDLVLYRKRQLEAMESDRKTLAALKAAMTNLGVEKKLSFITTPQQGMAFSGPTGETQPIVTSQ